METKQTMGGRVRRVLRAVSVTVLGALAAVVGVTGCMPSLGQAPTGSALERLAASPNFKEGRFVNQAPIHDFFDHDVDEIVGVWWEDTDAEPSGPIPVQDARSEAERDDTVRVTWVGHSTLLVELDGVRVLTDPIWSERCSPVGWAGPKRHHPPAMSLDALGSVDAVIISHDHYDHLDHATVVELAKRGAHFFVPLGIGSHLESWGVEAYTELDWWQSATVRNRDGEEVKLVATPAQHFSGRWLTDRDSTLWASWAIVGPRKRVYFGGDTGYFAGFEAIGARLGPFDATLMPVGAYNPMWADIHLNPEEAVRAHRDVQGGELIPIHWGTFDLAPHTWHEPIVRLLEAAGAQDVAAHVPRPGQTVVIGAGVINDGWWRFGEHASPKTAALAPAH